MRSRYTLLLILFLLTSCVSSQSKLETPISTLETSQIKTTTPSVLSMISPTTPPTITVAPPAAVGLDPQGPWLIYKTSGDDVFIINKDGSGRTQLPYYAFRLIDPYDASSSLPLIAVSTVDKEMNYSSCIDIVSIPALNTIKHISLQSCPEIIPGCEIHPQASFSFEPKWSPDGRYLAFIGAIEGPTTDLYVYDGETDEIKRLTDGPNQVGWYYWSPDSKWIVHEEVSDFMGWQVESIWSASPVTDEVRWVFSPKSKRSQRLLGWIDNDSFITYEHSMYGKGNLVLSRIENGIVTSVFPGLFHDDVALDPETGTIAFYPFVGAPDTNIGEPGIYTISLNNINPTRIEIEALNILGWFEDIGYFLTSTVCPNDPGGKLGFTPDGSVACVKNRISSISPDNEWEILFDKGIHIINSSGESTLLLASCSDGSVYWRPDSNGVFIIPDGNVYYLDISTLELKFINDDLVSTFNSIHGMNSALVMWINK